MSQPQLSPRISELLVSHICHDLVSPVGAISNGIEFMEEMDGGPDALNLIKDSCNQASVRLQCFRLSYGAAGSGGNIKYGDIKNAFENYIAGGRTQLNWMINGPASMYPEGYMKVVLNALMLADAAIPGEGVLSISQTDSGVQITASGKRVEFKEGVEEAFKQQTSEDELNPRTVHAYLTKVFADVYGIKIDIAEKSPEKMVMTVGF